MEHETPSSEHRLHVLSRASRAFAEVVTDHGQLLEKIARSTADLVGDGCLVTLLADDRETLHNAACAHRDRGIETAYRAYLAGLAITKTTSAAISAQVIRSGEPMLVAEVSPERVVARSDPQLQAITARMNVHSFVVVPIRARQMILGSLSLFRSGPGCGYTTDDLAMLMDLADRAGLAIENTRLYAELERRVRERTAELEAANHELEAFSYTVAHDLRAPLRAIDTFSAALADQLVECLDPASHDHLARIRRAALRMSRLIDDLLELARVTRGELRRTRVDLAELASTIVSRLREGQPTRAIEVAIQPDLVAHADPRLVDVALTNLLGNAWKFTRTLPAARIEVGAVSDARPTTYFVRDDGVGFPPADAAKLFVAFQRLHGPGFEGTGIGLATVQRIVHRHGGRIWASGAIDRGATFLLHAGARSHLMPQGLRDLLGRRRVIVDRSALLWP